MNYQRDLGGERVAIMSVGRERAAVDAGGGGGEEAEVRFEREDHGVGAGVASSEPSQLHHVLPLLNTTPHLATPHSQKYTAIDADFRRSRQSRDRDLSTFFASFSASASMADSEAQRQQAYPLTCSSNAVLVRISACM